MSNNATWNCEGVEKATGNYVGVYLSSPDLANFKEARKRARSKAKAKWRKQGLTVVRIIARCVG